MVVGSSQGGDESGSARALFAAQLAELWAAAGDPTLQRVATVTRSRGRPAAAPRQGGGISLQRISDWRAGRNLPSRFEAFEPVLLTLIALAKPNSAPAELVDRRAWKRLWTAARDTAPVPAKPGTRMRADDSAQRPRVTTALRRDIDTFIGRDSELRRILESARPGRVLTVHTVDGMPGVGKTSLVTRAAHLLAERFPDGRYFVELNTHTVGQSPAEPADVLARLLTDLGLDPRHLPGTLVGRRDLWRDRVAGKRILLVLDDAADHAQIEPLLPASPGSLTLITSRRRLIALDGAVPLSLDVLEPNAAVDLFCRLSHRTTTGATEYAAIAEIVKLCGYLPLAIVLLAGRLAHHPSWTITYLATEFTTAHDRLAELDTGQRAVRAAFTTSYHTLPDERQRLFRRLGLHPGADFDAYAAAALADIPLTAARNGLDALYTDHLIEEIASGRYRFHDLVREFACGLVVGETAEERANAVERLLDYYEHTATAAAYPGNAARFEAPQNSSAIAAQSFPTYAAALTWIRRERANLLACLEHAGTADHLPRVIALTNALTCEMRLVGFAAPAIAIVQRAVVAPDTIDHRHARAFAFKDLSATWHFSEDYSTTAAILLRVLAHTAETSGSDIRAAAWRTLGRVRYLAGEYALAGEALAQARELYRADERVFDEAGVLGTLGWVVHLTGDYARAVDLIELSRTMYRELDARFGEAASLIKLGWVRYLIGDEQTGIEQLQLAQSIFQASEDSEDSAGAASALEAHAWVRYLSGDIATTIDLLQQTLRCHRQIGSLAGEAFVVNNLGWCLYELGDHAAAIGCYTQALEIYRSTGNRSGEASALKNIGLAHCAAGAAAAADESLRRALAISDELGNLQSGAESRCGLGWLHLRTGDHAAAAELLRQALDTFRAIGHRTGELCALGHVAELRLASETR